MANPNWYKGMKSPHPEGKPVGTKSKEWSTLEYWVEKIEAELPNINKEERMKVILEMFKVIAGKRHLPSLTPEDSLKSVNDLMAQLSESEKS